MSCLRKEGHFTDIPVSVAEQYMTKRRANISPPSAHLLLTQDVVDKW
jgi:hypothetical protein